MESISSRAAIGAKLEQVVAEAFDSMNFDVEVDKAVFYGQVDVYACKMYPFLDCKILIECKTNRVGIGDVNKFHSLVTIAEKEGIANKGIVVSLRGFTRNARAFVEKVGNIELVTLDQLENRFVDWREYLEGLIKNFETLELSRYYVQLNCIDENGSINPADTFIESWLAKSGRNCLVILGDYGSGKTSLCLKIAHDLAIAYKRQPEKSKLPIFIPLRDFSSFDNIKQLVTHILINEYSIPIPNYYAFERLMKKGKFLLILDGFDEMANKLDRASLFKNFEELSRLMVPTSKTILTCRTHYFRDDAELAELFSPDVASSFLGAEALEPTYNIVSLSRLTKTQVIEYLHRRFTRAWKKNLRIVEDVYNLEELSKTPILLELISRTLHSLRKVRQEVKPVTLYDIYTRYWLRKESRTRPTFMRPDQKELFMEEIAFKLYVDRKLSVHFNELGFVSGRFFRGLKQKNIDYAILTCSFLNRDKQGYYQFSHKSFMEYFVARKIAKEISNGNAVTYSREYLTPEVDHFLDDILKDKYDFQQVIQWLENHKDPNVRMNAAVTLGRSGQKEFVPLLRQCLEREEDIGVAGRIAEALQRLGDEYLIITFLKNLDRYSAHATLMGKDPGHRLLYQSTEPIRLEDKSIVKALIKNLRSQSIRVRKYAAFMLGRLGDRSCVRPLSRMLLEEEDVRTRRYVAAALGLIGETKAITTLQQVSQNDSNYFVKTECEKSIRLIRRVNKLRSDPKGSIEQAV